jgi:hypothetical protein
MSEHTATAVPPEWQGVYRVLEYVSRGRRYVDVEPYPDATARRALAALDSLINQQTQGDTDHE